MGKKKGEKRRNKEEQSEAFSQEKLEADSRC